MTSLFASHEILAAYAYNEDGTDPDIQAGIHLRLFAGLTASCPLLPFVIYRLRSSQSEPRQFYVNDKDGNMVPSINLSQLGWAEVTLILADDPNHKTVSVQLLPYPEDGLARVQLLDQRNQVISERDKGHWIFSAPVIHKLRLWGSAENVGIITRTIHIENVIDLISSIEPSAIMGFPLAGVYNWYLGLQNRDDALNRVKTGAPKRLNPMDEPDGPLSSLGSNEDKLAEVEAARIEATLKASSYGGGLEKILSNMVNDDTTSPWAQMENLNIPSTDNRGHYVSLPRLGSIQIASLDPGMAKFFGFSLRLDDVPNSSNESEWDTLAIAGVFAVDPTKFENELAADLTNEDPNERQFIDKIVGAAAVLSSNPDDLPNNPHDIMNTMIESAKSKGLLVKPFVAVVSPVSPWLPPVLPSPIVFGQHWQNIVDNLPSSLYRANFAFDPAPVASMIALSSKVENKWNSRHSFVPIEGFNPPERAVPIVFGYEAQTSSRILETQDFSKGLKDYAGLLSDHNIPSSIEPAEYRVYASDFFGRFGTPVEYSVNSPARPIPPPPVLRYSIERIELHEIEMSSTQSMSPGKIKITIAVPNELPFNHKDLSAEEIFSNSFDLPGKEKLPSSIIVPRLDDLSAGSMPISSIKITFGNQSNEVSLSAPGIYEVEFPFPLLAPQQTQELILSANFIDSINQFSKTASLPVKMTDARPPLKVNTGVGIYWTSTPGPSPEVELRLMWPAHSDSLYRVYLTDQASLKLKPSDFEGEMNSSFNPSRAQVAVAGCKKAAEFPHEIDRKKFRLLTEEPIKAKPGSTFVEFITKLPRSLETVQFLRVVPVNGEGNEAPFDQCGLVAVAVPDSRNPPPPQLKGRIDSTGNADLEVTASGFNLDTLRQEEPGLFDSSSVSGVQFPQYRICRAVSGVSDPIYANQIKDGNLAWKLTSEPMSVLSGHFVDSNAGRGLEPYVRYIYWAQVRLSPERRLPLNVSPIEPPGGITATDPINKNDRRRKFSRFSAPTTLMYVPSNPPSILSHDSLIISVSEPDILDNQKITIEVSDPPRAHSKAVGPYSLAIWYQWPNRDIIPIGNANGTVLKPGTWPSLDKDNGKVSSIIPKSHSIPSPSTVNLHLAIVDPVGRQGPITVITVAVQS